MLQHREILVFCEHVSAKGEEEERRKMAVRRVEQVARSVWAEVEVRPIGSFATGLYLRSGDIDVLLLNAGGGGGERESAVARLEAFAARVEEAGIAVKKPELKGVSTVPIVRFQEKGSGVVFDISLDGRMELQTVQWVKQTLIEEPALRPLYLVLKVFMVQKELNIYKKGGLNSYALLVMIRVFLQLHVPSSSSDKDDSNLGTLLVGFFHFYGCYLNVMEYGVSCHNGGHCFRKVERGFYYPLQPSLLAIEDPLRPSNDLGQVSFGFPSIQAAFHHAHHLLTSVPETGSSNFLARIIEFDDDGHPHL